MSEYQYYEFQAIDRPLTEKEMDELRSYSSRAEITPTSFINEYQWGDFKGDPNKLMERYFDVFFYYANWGTHQFKLRLPSKLLPAAMVEQYCVGDSMYEKQKHGNTVVSFDSDDEGGDDGCAPELSSLLSVRSELARGDMRALYLGWLMSARNGEFKDTDVEPPVPPSLGALSAADRQAEEQQRLEAEKAAKAKVRREQEAALARAKRLDALEGREASVWTEVGQCIATKLPKQYDEAVTLLIDLRDLALRKGAEGEFRAHLRDLRAANSSKSSFLARVRDAGL